MKKVDVFQINELFLSFNLAGIKNKELRRAISFNQILTNEIVNKTQNELQNSYNNYIKGFEETAQKVQELRNKLKDEKDESVRKSITAEILGYPKFLSAEMKFNDFSSSYIEEECEVSFKEMNEDELLSEAEKQGIKVPTLLYNALLPYLK